MLFLPSLGKKSHLMWRADSLEKTLMLGMIGGRRSRGRQRMRWLDGITYSIDMSLVNSGSWWWTGRPGVLQFTGSQRVGHNWATELNWAEGRLDTEEERNATHTEKKRIERNELWDNCRSLMCATGVCEEEREVIKESIKRRKAKYVPNLRKTTNLQTQDM